MGMGDANQYRYARITDADGNLLYEDGKPTPFHLEQERKRLASGDAGLYPHELAAKRREEREKQQGKKKKRR